MKNLITTAMLWIVISMSMLNAQYMYDTLHVVEQGVTIAQVIAPKIHDTREDMSWKVLIKQFQTQMQTVKEQVPEYLQYRIDFVRGQRLTIEDDQSIEKVLKYNIQSGSVVPIAQVSKAILLDDRIEVRLFFGDIEDMYTKNYITIIESAFEKMKIRPKLIQGLKDLYFPRDLNYYNNSTAQFEKGPSKKGRLKVAGSIDATVGVFRNDFAFHVNYGLGIAFGRNGDKSLMIALSSLSQYDEEQKRGRSASLFGGVYRINSLISFGFFKGASQGEEDFFNIENRFRISLYPRRGGKFSINWDNPRSERFSIIGFEYGIPLGFGYERNSYKKTKYNY